MKRVTTVVVLSVILFSGAAIAAADEQNSIRELHARIHNLEQELNLARSDVALLRERLDALEAMIDLQSQSLTTRNVIIVDSQGTQRARLSSVLDLPSLTFYDSAGELLLYMSESSYVPSMEEWSSLLTTAYNNSQIYLTDNLLATSMTVEYLWWNAIQSGLPSYHIAVNTTTQPGWSVYMGNGRFSVSDRVVRAAYNAAAQYIVTQLLRGNLTERPHDDILITFYIHGAEVGYWTNGMMTLAGE